MTYELEAITDKHIILSYKGMPSYYRDYQIFSIDKGRCNLEKGKQSSYYDFTFEGLPITEETYNKLLEFFLKTGGENIISDTDRLLKTDNIIEDVIILNGVCNELNKKLSKLLAEERK